MTQKEEKMMLRLNDLEVRLERVHSLAAALMSMLEDDPKARHDYTALTSIIKSESEIN